MVVASGQENVAGLPISRLASPAVGPDGAIAYLASSTAVFRRESEVIRHTFAAGQSLGGDVIAAVGDGVVDERGCVIAALVFRAGAEALYRRCTSTTEPLLSVGATLDDGATLTRLGTGRPAAGGLEIAVEGRRDDGESTIVRVSGGMVAEIARTGEPSPAGGTLSSIRLVGVSRTGQVGFSASVSGGRDGLFRGDGDGVAKVVVEGDATAGGRLDSIAGASQSPPGLWAFAGALEDGRRGVFRLDGGAVLPVIVLLAAEGDPVAGHPGTIIASLPDSLVPSINALGNVAFRATLSGIETGSGIFLVTGDAPAQLLVTTKEETPFGVLARLRDPQLADDDSLVIGARPLREGDSLFAHRDGTLSVLARFGESTDLAPLGGLFRFTAGCVRQRAEDAVFTGTQDGIYLDDGAGVRQVAALGEPSPFGGVFAELGAPAIDARGDVAFRGEVEGATTGQGIFRSGGSAVIHDLAAAGEKAPKGGNFRDLPVGGASSGGDVSAARRLVAFRAGLESTGADAGLFRVRRRKASLLERAGRRAPEGGEYVEFGVPVLVSAKRYAFIAQVRDQSTRSTVVARRGRKRRLVAQAGRVTDSRFGGRFGAFVRPDARKSGVVFLAELASGVGQGIFFYDWRRSAPLLGTGDLDAGGAALRDFGRPVFAGEAVLLRAAAGEGRIPGLYRIQKAAGVGSGIAVPELLVQQGAATPLGGRVLGVEAVAGGEAGEIAAHVTLEEASARHAIFRIVDESP